MKRKGFTLVELLTVIAIIVLLISILVPVVSRARRQAKEAAVQAQLHAIEVGLEMFHTDFGFYPSSTPEDPTGSNDPSHSTGSAYTIQGAHRLALALMGRDKLGCPGDASGHPDSITGIYYTDDGTFSGSEYDPSDTEWGNPAYKTPRKGPYINPERFLIIADETLDLGTNNTNPPDDYLWLICDKFNKPKTPIDGNYSNYSLILYYAANTRGQFLSDQDSSGQPDDTSSDGSQIYYWEDNYRLTNNRWKDWDGNSGYNEADFFIFINDSSAKIGNYYMPHNKDTYLLISPGFDGIYGTDDDIVNWQK